MKTAGLGAGQVWAGEKPFTLLAAGPGDRVSQRAAGVEKKEGFGIPERRDSGSWGNAFGWVPSFPRSSFVTQLVKNPPAVQKTWV